MRPGEYALVEDGHAVIHSVFTDAEIEPYLTGQWFPRLDTRAGESTPYHYFPGTLFGAFLVYTCIDSLNSLVEKRGYLLTTKRFSS